MASGATTSGCLMMIWGQTMNKDKAYVVCKSFTCHFEVLAVSMEKEEAEHYASEYETDGWTKVWVEEADLL